MAPSSRTVSPGILLATVQFFSPIRPLYALSFYQQPPHYSHPRHDFPRTKLGQDQNEILTSEGFKSAIRFLDRIHEERYGGGCPILAPAWEEHTATGGVPQLPPCPLGSLDPSVPLSAVATSYSRDEQRTDESPSPLGSSASQLSAEFASVKRPRVSSKGFGSKRGSESSGRGATARSKRLDSSGSRITGSIDKRKKRGKKWSADEGSGGTQGGATRPTNPRKWRSDLVKQNGDAVASVTQDRLNPPLTCPSLFDDNFCHVTSGPIFSTEECQAIISEAEENTEVQWQAHEQYYKEYKITRNVNEMPKTKEFFGRACIERIFPLLQKMYPSVCPQTADGHRDFRVFSAKVLRYDSSRGDDYLGTHHDGSLLTFLVGLNDIEEYEGGGTYFEAIGKAIRYGAGHLCCHPGIVRHGGAKVTSGTRYVLAAWIDVHGVKEYDRQLCEEADLIRMGGRLDQTLRYDIGTGISSDLCINDSKIVSRLEKAERWYIYSLAAGERYSRLEAATDPNDEKGKVGNDPSAVSKLTSENAWLGLGQLWLDRGRVVDAADAFRNALDLSPFNTRAWMSYGLALVKLNEVAGATHAFQTAADMNDYDFDSLSNLGLLFSIQGKHEEASKTFESAVGRIQQGGDGSIKADKRAAAELYTK